MEGPAVKRFVTAPSISWSMLTSEYLSGRHGRFPEDAGARLTMERLRRRIRLICAGCSEEQSRMTPLRRELPPSTRRVDWMFTFALAAYNLVRIRTLTTQSA